MSLIPALRREVEAGGSISSSPAQPQSEFQDSQSHIVTLCLEQKLPFNVIIVIITIIIPPLLPT